MQIPFDDSQEKIEYLCTACDTVYFTTGIERIDDYFRCPQGHILARGNRL